MIEVIWLNFQKGSYLLMVLLCWPFNSLYYSPSLGKVALHDFVTCLAAQATSKDVALSTQTLNELKGRWTLHQPKSSNWPEMTTFHEYNFGLENTCIANTLHCHRKKGELWWIVIIKSTSIHCKERARTESILARCLFFLHIFCLLLRDDSFRRDS